MESEGSRRKLMKSGVVYRNRAESFLISIPNWYEVIFMMRRTAIFMRNAEKSVEVSIWMMTSVQILTEWRRLHCNYSFF